MLFSLFVLAASTSITTVAQDTQPVYAVVDYMRVNNGQDYLAVEKVWKEMHQQLVDEGLMAYWGLYQVVFPSGADRPYGAVTVRIYNDVSRIMNPFPQEKMEAFAEGLSEEDRETMSKTAASRDIVSSEMLRLRLSVRGENPQLGPYLHVSYVDTEQGGAGTYGEIEEKYWKPIHEQRVAKNVLSGWDVWQLMFAGTNNEYDHGIVSIYDDFAQLAEPDYSDEIIAAAHPDASEEDLNAVMTETLASRKIVRSSVWVRIDETMPPAN